MHRLVSVQAQDRLTQDPPGGHIAEKHLVVSLVDITDPYPRMAEVNDNVMLYAASLLTLDAAMRNIRIG